MAICVQLNVDGTLTPTADAVAECPGYVMVSGAEYGVYSTVQEVMGPPTHDQVVEFFSLGLFGPLALYMLGRMYGSVAGFFDRA